MYEQVLNPVGGSGLWSSVVAALPLLAVFVLLGSGRLRAHWTALAGLAVALVLAVWVYGMPAGQAVSAALEGAAFGLFPIMWIVVNALWIYRMTVDSGHFDVLRRSFGRVSDDQRLQAVVIAFCFGALLEALAGFGTPVAVTSVMLIAVGFTPLRAAVVALVANTAPVAYGAIATPVITLSNVTGYSVRDLGATIGRQTPVLAVLVPLVLVFIVDGRRGLRETWQPALLGGLVFGIAQFACASYGPVELTDIVAALASAAVLVGWTRLPHARRTREASADEPPGADGGGGATEAEADAGATLTTVRATPPVTDAPAEVVRAYAPYAAIIAVFSVAQIPAAKELLAKGVHAFAWPGLYVVNAAGKPVSFSTYNFNWLPAGGTLLLLAGVISAVVLGVRPGPAVRAYGANLRQLAPAIATVACVLGLAYVMNLSGQTATIGHALASATVILAVLSPVLGWIGTAITGSDTSSNALFGTLQVTAAKGAGLSPTLLAAANSSGGVLGKMVSPQNLAIVAAAAHLHGQEGRIFRRVVGYSAGMLVFLCLLVWLQSTAALSWMLP
ncbi:L-lactate permease [Actinacidiphila soli]|uniref:L-lactate permease n=1 Tax=Actinacidiphila soli TaxID=2487275 RepID=UPI000FC9B739|nr:L-lactate permease [Actinacidiphila soli]